MKFILSKFKIRIKINYFFILLFTFLFNNLLISSNYFWIGGSGNWSDINHWATGSGSSSLHSVVPGQNDDIFFDLNSGFLISSNIVTIDVIANCHNLTWNGALNNPSLDASASFPLNIHGSMTLQAGMFYNVMATYFKSTSITETITTNNVNITGNIYLSGIGGKWTLQDNYNSVNNIYAINGALNTNNKTLNIDGFYSGENFPTSINSPDAFDLTLGSSIININSSLGGAGWYYYGTGTLLNAGTSHVIFTNSIGNGLSFYGNTGHTYYNVTSNAGINNWGASLGFGINSSFHKVILNKGATINGNNLFDSLFLQGSGQIYNFTSSTTQTITSIITSTVTTCTGLTQINSSTSGIQANLFFISGAACTVNNAIIKDINITGSIPTVTVNSSFDLGNNTNITFPLSVSNNLYWRGGSGDWNDINHWSFSSGGATGACIPTPLDNVIFDLNSDFTPTSNTVNLTGFAHYCHNMTWVGALNNPIFNASSSNVLNIYGSLTLQNSMSYSVLATYFKSTLLGETITTNAAVVNGNIYFSGIGGEWIMLDDYNSTNNIYLINGKLNTNSNTLSVLGFYSGELYPTSIDSPNSFDLNLGASIININSNADRAGWYYYGTGTSLNAGTSHIIFTNSFGTNLSFYGNTGHNYHNVTCNAGVNGGGASVGLGINSNFHRVILNKGGIINGSNKFDSLLLLGSSQVYSFYSSNTQTITSTLISTVTSCSGLTQINSVTPGIQANISFLMGATCTVSNAIIKDINATGPIIPIIANASYDLGNNTNINFPSYTSNNLYWVGGAGDWNDVNHWSFIDGGIGGLGGVCIPTPLDNVFFTALSGFSSFSNIVSLTGPAHYCHNMTWNGALNTPIISALSSNLLNIYGSLTLQNLMQYNVTATYFKSINLGETITTNATSVNGNIYFNGIGGEWTLQDNYLSNFDIYAINGKLNTNNKTIDISSFYSGENYPSAINFPDNFTLNLGTSIININSGLNGTGWYYYGTGTNLNAGTSNINFTNASGTSLSFYGNTGHNYYNVTSKAGINNSGAGLGFGIHSNFHKVILNKSSTLIGNNTIDTLILKAGQTYKLDNISTQTITQRLYASGNPCFLIYLQSTNPGSKAFLNVQSGIINYNFANVKDIDASTSYTSIHFAGQSTDAGNNLNLIFAPTSTTGINGLGPDTSICENKLPITINTNDFYANDETTFLWPGGITTPTLTVGVSGTYSITVNYGDFCVVNDFINITSNPTPTITSTSATICNGNTATLLASGAVNYTWSPTAAISSSIIVTPTITTTYTINGTDANGCANTTTTNIIVNNLPTVITTSATICVGKTSTLTASGAMNYTWSPSATINSSISVTPTITTIYSVIGTDANGCSSISTTSVVVDNLPTITSASVAICIGKSGTLTASGATNYTWSPSASISSSSFTDSVIANPTISTTYSVIGTDANGCTNTSTTSVVVNNLPTVTSTSATICYGNSSSLTANGAVNYTWSPSATLSSSITVNVIATPTITTTYSIVGTDVNGCVNSGTTNIVVLSLPSIFATSSPTNICSGFSTTLTAFGATSYTWMPGSLSTNPVNVSPGITTTYSLTGSNTTGTTTCYSTNTVIVKVIPSTTVNIMGLDSVCFGSNATLYANAGNTYTWSSTSIINDPNSYIITVSPSVTTVYSITASNAGICPGTATFQIVVNPLPTVYAGVDTTINIDETYILNGVGNAPVGFLSQNGIPQICNFCPTVEVNPTETTCYTLKGENSHHCVAYDEVCIKVTKDWDIFIPNTFTPNEDSNNDIFIPIGYGIKDIKLTIYDRWGVQIFKSDDTTKGWNGKYNDVPCQHGVYVFMVEITALSGVEVTKTGHVTLLPKLK